MPSPDIVKCMATFVEWFFYTSSPVQTDATLADQDALLREFNELKAPFVDVSPSSLNFPKFHSLQHFSETTKRFGTPDNADTEVTEHQHRVDVKIPYRRTNKRNALAQVIRFVERRGAFENKLDHLSMSETKKTAPSITVNFRKLSGHITNEPIGIDEASKRFEIPELELAVQTFFHDLKFPGTGHRHRVSKKKFPRLSDPRVYKLLFFCSS